MRDAGTVAKTDDARRAARRRSYQLRITSMIGASYAVDTLILCLYVLAGTITAQVPALYVLAACVGTYAAHRGGWTGRFDDRRTTMYTMILSSWLQLAFLAYAPQAGVVFLMVLFITCSFGALRLTPLQFAAAWAAIVAPAGALFVLLGARIAMPMATPPERLATFVVVAAALGRCVVIWLYGAAIRNVLAERNQAHMELLDAAVHELEDLSYSMSHNLRAPVRAINANAHLLELDYGEQLPEGARALAGKLVASALAMGSMIDGLLDLLATSRANPARCMLDVSRLAQKAWDELERSASNQDAVFTVAADLRADADEGMLYKLLHHLLDNTRKFKSAGSPLRVEFGAQASDGRAAFFVRDNGIGFDPAYAARLFKPFETLHGAGAFAGNGLGLSIAARVVARHGGKIWAESLPGQTTTFYFTLG